VGDVPRQKASRLKIYVKYKGEADLPPDCAQDKAQKTHHTSNLAASFNQQIDYPIL